MIMGMYKRYEGEFLSRKGVIWRAEIWQEADAQFPVVGELRFPADNPLSIEWAHTDKEEVICGSSASLTIVSPGDRTYEDLYTIQPGRVRLDTYRNGNLYWSGTLDPEFYEEPYCEAKEYDVQLTFSDFGILDRYKYRLGGVQTLFDLVKHCADMSGICYGDIRQDYISTSLDGQNAMSLSDLSIRSENFYDEDGEASTLYEVLEGIFQPLGIRMVQRKGQVWLYDLNGLYTLGETKEVTWTDSDQVMGTDKVVNDVRITFSPYANSKLPIGEVKYEGECSEDIINLTSQTPAEGPECYTYYPDYEREWDYENLSFSIFLSTQGSGLEEINSNCRYFRIQPLLGGSEAEGVAWGFYTGGHGDLNTGWPKLKLNKPALPDGSRLMTCKKVPIQCMEKSLQAKYMLRLSMEILMDPRYNPFTGKGKNNESGNFDRFNSWANYVMIPAAVVLRDEEGNILYHYRNVSIARRTDLIGDINYSTQGEWVSGEPSELACWLSWYDVEDRSGKTGVTGWKANRHCIGLSTEDVKDSFKEADAGQYIPYPPTSGYLEVVIYSGMYIHDRGEEWGNVATATNKGLWDKVRWMLYKAPKLEIVKSNIVYGSANSEDVEYQGLLNADAKEDLELDTICGTMKKPLPTALGVYLNAANKELVSTLSRAGRTTQAEQLLIGSLYSQYATRKTKLTGTVQLMNDVPVCYTEACQDGKRFICLEDIQNVITDESCVELVELRPDEYEEE